MSVVVEKHDNNFWKLSRHWVLDAKHKTGYKVVLNDSDVVIDYREAFRVRREDGQWACDRSTGVPLGIIRKAYRVLEKMESSEK